MLGVAVVLSMAQGAQTFMSGGVQVVDIQEFARENKLTYKNDFGTITLKSPTTTLVLFTGSRQSQRNGQAQELATPLANISDRIVAPLADLQRAFGLKVTGIAPMPSTTAEVKTPSTSTPAPATSATQSRPTPLSSTFTLIPTNRPLGTDLFQGSPGSDYLRLNRPRPFDDNIAISHCLAAISQELINPDSLQYSLPISVGIYTDGGYFIMGDGLTKNYGGTMAPFSFSCGLRIMGEYMFIKASIK